MMIPSQRRGFSLIELLCVITLLGVIGLVLGLLLRETLDIERMQTASFDQMLQRNALADQFRADVAHAEKALDEWHVYKSGSETLILQMTKDAHVVYRWHKGELNRHAFEGDQETRRMLPIDATKVAVDFPRAEADARLIRLRLRPIREGKTATGRTVEIAAALGGDSR